MRAQRSPIFRNSDDETRRRERAAAADPGDDQAAARHAMAMARAGRLDQCTVEALDLAPSQVHTLAWASWQRATGEGRIRLFRALRTAGLYYPEPAFLRCLSGTERELCYYVASFFHGNANIMENRLRRTLWPPARRDAWAVAGDEPSVIEVVRGGNDGNTQQFTGSDGLSRAIEEAKAVEANWAELVKCEMRHRRASGTGFSGWSLFLTPTGYALRYILYSGDRDDNGVIEWSYMIREGHFADHSDPFFSTDSLSTISAVHRFGVVVQRMIANYAEDGMTATQNRLETSVENAIMLASQTWVRIRSANRKEDPKDPGNLVPASTVSRAGNRTCVALVVVPPASDVPIATLGVKLANVSSRTRKITPANAWSELAPWRGDDSVLEEVGRALAARLLAWVKAKPVEQYPGAGIEDRVSENARVMVRWAEWTRMMSIRRMS